jgi:hypothetical protein
MFGQDSATAEPLPTEAPAPEPGASTTDDTVQTMGSWWSRRSDVEKGVIAGVGVGLVAVLLLS